MKPLTRCWGAFRDINIPPHQALPQEPAQDSTPGGSTPFAPGTDLRQNSPSVSEAGLTGEMLCEIVGSGGEREMLARPRGRFRCQDLALLVVPGFLVDSGSPAGSLRQNDDTACRQNMSFYVWTIPAGWGDPVPPCRSSVGEVQEERNDAAISPSSLRSSQGHSPTQDSFYGLANATQHSVNAAVHRRAVAPEFLWGVSPRRATLWLGW
jgi:hypothetical protein